MREVVHPVTTVALPFPQEVAMGPTGGEGEGYFVAPTKGPSPAQVWVNNSQLAGDHVMAGSFDTAMRVSSRFIHAELHVHTCTHTHTHTHTHIHVLAKQQHRVVPWSCCIKHFKI